MSQHTGLPIADKKPRFFYGYVILVAGFLALMITGGAQYSFGVFFKPILTEFGWTREATAGAYSLSMVLIACGGIFAGRLTDRFGPRLMVTVSGSLVGLGYLLMSQVSAIWQVYLCYGVMVGIGIAGIWVPLLSTVARWFIRGRGLASGIVASGMGVGIIVMPPLADHLITRYSWRPSYVIVGLMALVIVIIIAQFLRRDPAQIGQSAYGADTVRVGSPDVDAVVTGFSFREAIRTPQLWAIGAVLLVFGLCVQTTMVHAVPHATDIGISASAAATILSVIGFVSIGSKVGMGSIGDRIGNKRIVVAISVLMLAAFLWLRIADKLWMLYLFAVIFSFGYGGWSVVQSPLVAEFFGLRAHGAIFGLTAFASGIGGAIGPIVAGRLFDLTNSYLLAFTVMAVLSAVSLVLAVLLKRPVKPIAASSSPDRLPYAGTGFGKT